MSRISIVDLEVFYCVGVPDEERAKPQRLLITVDFDFDFSVAAVTDRIEKTINYQQVVDSLLSFGEGRSWKLIEKLATNIAERLMVEYKPHGISVEIKKFVIPQTRYISVAVNRQRPG